MTNIFCPACGRANQYNTTKPNFCMYCAASFNVSAASSEPAPRQPQPRYHDDRYQTVRARRDRPADPEFDNYVVEEDRIADRHELKASVGKISLVVKELPDNKKLPGEEMNLGQVFGLGSRDTSNASVQVGDRPDDYGKTFQGGNKQAYLTEVFGGNMKQTRIDAKESA